jgi:hypothetical protein
LKPLAQATGENQRIPNAAMLMLFAKTDQILRSDRAHVVATSVVVLPRVLAGTASPAAKPADVGLTQPMLVRRAPACIAKNLFICPEMLLFLDFPRDATIDATLKQAAHPAAARTDHNWATGRMQTLFCKSNMRIENSAITAPHVHMDRMAENQESICAT